MNLDLDRCGQDIKQARLRVQSLVSDLAPDQFTKRPEAGKWSVAECILHLNTTAEIVQSLMEKAIAEGKRSNTVGSGPFGVGFKGQLLFWIAEPPPKFRMRAPKKVRPPAAINDPAKLLPDFLKAQDEWERLMREQKGLDLVKIKVGQGAFRMRLAGVVPWMMAHQRRHLLQAENVKRQILSAAPKTVARAG
jgi:uncharacterized damage-inducible protein DinB